jgi:hypothetical protein
VRSGHGVGVLDAHLALEAVRVPEEDAEDGAEIGDEVITGAPGDEPVPDLVERVERRGLQPEMVDAARPNIGACRSASVLPATWKTFSSAVWPMRMKVSWTAPSNSSRCEPIPASKTSR